MFAAMQRTPHEPELRKKIVETCQRMYRQGYIAAGDGNVSCKLDDERVLVTPTGLHKGLLGEADLVIVDLDGKLLRGAQGPTARRPSSEFLMHALAYRERPDVRAVVHAHPPLTVALALAGISLAQCLLSETCLVLGPILTAPYSTPTTEEVPRVLRPFVRQANAIVMDRHGALTLGRDLDEAYNRLEAMEHASKITQAARAIGPLVPLPPVEVGKLESLARSLGIPRPPDPCTLCNACDHGKGGPITSSDDAVVDAVLARLRG